MSDFFTNYAIYTSDNYAPDVWHQWCSFGTLAACLSRRVFCEIGRFRYYPNLYVCLDGDTGWGKNTALERALRIVRAVGVCTISATRQSKEDLICDMARSKVEYRAWDDAVDIQTPYLVYAPELAQWLSIDPVGMVDLWTSLFDELGDFSCGTVKHGRQVIRGPYTSILCGVQPDKLSKYMSFEALSTGFMRRCNFIWPLSLRPKKLYHEVTEEHRRAYDYCLATARHAASLCGPFRLDKDALHWYINWFETRRTSQNPLIKNYDEGLHVQLLKLAMLTCVGRAAFPTITKDHLLYALAHLDTVKASLPRVLSGVGRNDLAAVGNILLNYIRDAGGTVLQRDARVAMWNHCKEDEFLAIINHFQATGLIDVAQTTTEAGFIKPALILREHAH